MFRLLALAFIVVPVLEWWVFAEIADEIGFGTTLLWIVAVSVIGAALVKREGISALRRANQKAAAGQIPTDELINGVMILFAGALMLTPGFLTDAVGLVLLFPPTRSLLRSGVRRRVRAGDFTFGQVRTVHFGSSGFPGSGFGADGPGGRRRDDDVWDAESWESDEPGRGPDGRPDGELGR